MIEACYFSDEISPDFEEAVHLGSEAGAYNIEIRSRIFRKAVQDVNDDDVKKMKEILTKYNARVAVIGSPCAKCALDSPEECAQHVKIFQRMCSLAHAFETDLIRTFPFSIPEGRDKSHRDRTRPDLSRYLDRIVEGLRPMVRIAENEGVKMCFETEGSTFSGNCRELCTIMDALDSSAVMATWDILNSWCSGDEIPYPDTYQLIRGRIAHLHIKPNKQYNIKTVGESASTYEQIFRALLADGYNGGTSIEHWGSPELMLSGIRQLVALLNIVQAK